MRPAWAFLYLAAAVALVGCGREVPAPVTPADHTKMNRHADAGAAIESSNVRQLALAWKVETDEPVSHAPIVRNGRAYFADWGGHVYAVDATSGSQIWKRRFTQPNPSWPWYGFAGRGTVVGDTLFEASVEGDAYAIDTATGAEKWKTRFADDPQAGSLSALLAHDGLLYVGVSSVEEGLATRLPPSEIDFRGSVVALDTTTGAIRWRRTLAPAPGRGAAVWGSFALDTSSGTLFFATGRHHTGEAGDRSGAIVAVDARTGAIRWSRQAPAGGASTVERPAGPDLDFGTGPQLFEANVRGALRKLVGAGQKSGVYWALDRATGQVVWRTALAKGGELGGMLGDASAHGGAVYVWGNEGFEVGKRPEGAPMTVAKLDAGSGRPIWTIPHAQPALLASAGFLANDVYLVGSLDGRVRAYAAADGRRLWTSAQHGSIASSLEVAGNMLLFGTGVPGLHGGQGKSGVYAYALRAMPRSE